MEKKNKPNPMEKTANNFVFGLFFFIICLQLLLNGAIHRSLSNGSYLESTIILEELDIESVEYLSQCLQDSLDNETNQFLAFPNYTTEPGLALEHGVEESWSNGQRRRRVHFRRERAYSRPEYVSSSVNPISEFGSAIEPMDVNGNGLSIVIAIRSTFNQSTELAEGTLIHKKINRFTLDAFEAAVKLLPYKLSYQIVPFHGSHFDILKEISHKSFDAALGDIIITSEDFKLVEFSQPYVEAGLVMLVKTKTDKLGPWSFLRLFSSRMWLLLVATSFFTGFVIWLIDYQNQTNSGGSLSSNATTDSTARPINDLLFAFASLYNAEREKPTSILSCFVLAPWFLLAVVVGTTFTTNFTSMTTNSQIESSKIDINMLRNTNAAIGCHRSTFVNQYLVKVLGFKRRNIRSIDSIDQCAETLASGNIKVAFILMPYAKVFLGKYCTGFAITGPTYDLGGFGFAFPKNSTIASDISRAIVKLKESGELRQIEERMVSSFNCSASPLMDNVSRSLGPEPFLGFFIISGSVSSIALCIVVIRFVIRLWNRTDIQAVLMGRGIWIWLTTLLVRHHIRIEIQPESRSSNTEAEG